MVLLKRENDRLQKELLQRDDSLKAREAALQSRAAELEKLHARLAQQDATLKCREVLMDKREAALLAREQGTVLSSTDDVATDATLASKSAMPPPPPKQKSVRTEPQSPRTVPPSPRPISVDSTPQGRRLQLYGSPMVLSTPFQNMREPTDLNRDTSADKTRRTASSENSPGRSPMAMTGSSLNGFASIESTPTRRTTAPSSTLGNTRMYRSPLGAVQSATGSPLLAKDLFRAQRFGFVDKENSSTTMPMAKMRPKDGNVVTTIDNDVDDATMEKLGAWLDSVHIRSATTTPNKR